MSSENERPHVGEQHVAESDDSMKLTPSNWQVRNVTNGSPGQNSAETTTLQSPLQRRPPGSPATKCPSVERGHSDEKSCTVQKKAFTEKVRMAKKRHVAKKYYIMVKTTLSEKVVLQEYSCNDNQSPATGKRSFSRKHQSKKQFSGKTHRVSKKSPSFGKHLLAEKDLPTKRAFLKRKRQLTENGGSTEEGGFSGRDYYGGRGHAVEKHQPAKKGHSTTQSPFPKKRCLDGRGPSTENRHLQENDRSAKKLSCTERYHQIEGECSVKRRLSTEKDHPGGRS
ncbi:hypothetical protein H671_xg20065 [Cricetulus griseus]|uniref:Uncharacterized protein n=1 Tax=Cricetulus griseus TaxID=10029 RepID=A0A061HV05_CRIGR|nr:hypothetical protein H671_xg20065 [Cricetulus griseus]